MSESTIDVITTPRQNDLGLVRIANRSGLSISLLPNGAIFALEHTQDGGRIMINQAFASPIADGMGGLYLRAGGAQPVILPVIGPKARCRVAATDDRIVWEGEQQGVSHRVSLWLHPDLNLWLWRVEVINRREEELPCDAVFVQDLGLGEQGFLMNNEAYASQYLDHFIAQHRRMNFILMSRQNLAATGRTSLDGPWLSRRRRGFRNGFSPADGAGLPRCRLLPTPVWDKPPFEPPPVRDRMRRSPI